MSAPHTDQRPLVGLDVGAARHPLSGVGIYISELVAALSAQEGRRIVRLGRRDERLFPPERALPGETRLRGRHHLAWIIAFADRDARSAGCGVVHYTNAIAPLRSSVPFVLTIQDLSVLRHPRLHPVARLSVAPFIVLAARRARRVLVPSSATADEVRRLLHVPAGRIRVIPYAARRRTVAAPDDEVVSRLGLEPGRFVLSLGTIEPRKNHLRLLAAFERLAAVETDLRLVLAGSNGWRSAPLWRALERSPMRERVVVAGYQPDAAVAALLRASAVMAYPSVYEGFGLPILEAMAAGAPVVTSSVSSMPEAAGGAAVLVDPTDVRSIAAGLAEAIRRRAELIEAGIARAASRTWADVARETCAAYDEALESAA